MNKLICFSLFLLVSCVLRASPVPSLSYKVSPLKKGDYQAVVIDLTLKGNATGKTLLSIPFETGMYRSQDHFRIERVINSRKHQRAADDSSTYLVEHEPNALLTITYVVTNALKDSLPDVNEVYAQMLTDKWFYLLGHTVWVVPQDSSSSLYDITVNWTGFPANWKYLSSHSGNTNKQRFRSSLADLHNAVYMGGDFHVYQEMIHGKPLYLGIRGTWSFTDEQVFEMIKKTVIAQRGYWNDYDVDHYTIGVLPVKFTDPNAHHVDGRGFAKTFVTAGTNSQAVHLEGLVFLYNHELMHHWLGYVLQQGEPENRFKWFHEGFTDYFAHAAMLDAGMFDEKEFKQRINHVFSSYYKDSAHQLPNEKLAADYWSSPAMKILPYQRGLVFAYYLNESIGSYSKGRSSLKQVVKCMIEEAKVNKEPFSVRRFLRLLQEATGKDYSTELERFIEKGEFISIADWQKVSDKVILGHTEVYDLGFTTDKNGIALNAKITSLTPGGDAQKVGLQVGDVMVGYSSKMQPTIPASITVKRGEEVIKLSYLPSRQVMVPQVK